MPFSVARKAKCWKSRRLISPRSFGSIYGTFFRKRLLPAIAGKATLSSLERCSETMGVGAFFRLLKGQGMLCPLFKKKMRKQIHKQTNLNLSDGDLIVK